MSLINPLSLRGHIGIPDSIFMDDPKGQLLHSAADAVDFRETEEATQVFFEWLANHIYMKLKLTNDEGKRHLYKDILRSLSTNYRMRVAWSPEEAGYVCTINPELYKENK